MLAFRGLLLINHTWDAKSFSFQDGSYHQLSYMIVRTLPVFKAPPMVERIYWGIRKRCGKNLALSEGIELCNATQCEGWSKFWSLLGTEIIRGCTIVGTQNPRLILGTPPPYGHLHLS